jgi:HEAT repeat protein
MLTSSAPQISIQRPMMPPPMFFAAGGMGVLANMMENSGSDNQRQAAQVVFEACSDNPHNQQLLHESGAMQKMVQLLQTGSTQEVKSRAAEAIAAACAQNRDNRREALQANALEPLVNMLEASNVQTQESAANALANVINSRETAGMLPETGIAGHVLSETGQNALHRLGGVRKLVHLVETGVPRVKEAAAAAIANAMLDNESNRIAFQEAGGVAPLVNLLKSGDINAQEHATTALWNAMVDNEATRIDLISHPQGLPLLIQVLWSGTEVTKESAAGAIWKACVADTSIKDRLFVAIPALVQLLENGSAGGQTQAAGALRGVLINSTLNKQELNRCGGISALVSILSSASYFL